jgi:hypothetical protein
MYSLGDVLDRNKNFEQRFEWRARLSQDVSKPATQKGEKSNGDITPSLPRPFVTKTIPGLFGGATKNHRLLANGER